MKTFAVLFVVALFAISQASELTEEQKEKIRTHHKECLTVSGVDEELVKKTKEGVWTDDAKLKTHLLCMCKKAGFMTEAGEIDTEVIKTKMHQTKLTEDKITKAMTCVVKKDTPEVTAYEMIKCWKTLSVKIAH